MKNYISKTTQKIVKFIEQRGGINVSFSFSGLILKLPFLGQPPDQNCYDDSIYWEVRNFSFFCHTSHVWMKRPYIFPVIK